MPPTDWLSTKQTLKDELLRLLEHEYETLDHAQKTTVAGATHEEAKPENDKDTRALEQSYLARGQAERVEQLRQDIAQLRGLKLRLFSAESPVALGALVTLEHEDGQEQQVLLVPAGAGEPLLGPEGPIRAITPRSPLGAALLGAYEGEEVELAGPTGKRSLSLARVL